MKSFFPAENQFLPKDLDLKFDESLRWPHLRKVASDENSELWYKMDHIFRLPKIQASIRFGNSVGQETLESQAKLDLCLYVMGIFLENIDQISVLAEAGYKLKIGGTFKNAEMKPPLTRRIVPPSIQFEGFSCNFHDFFVKIVGTLASIQFDAETVVHFSNHLRSSYLRHLKTGHGHDNADVGSEFLFSEAYSLTKRAKKLIELSHEQIYFEKPFFSQMSDFIRDLFSESLLQVHIEGNITQNEAFLLYEFTKNAFKQSSSKNKMVLPKIRKISEPVAIKVENFNECHPMSYTLQSWQIGKIDTPRKEAMLTFMVSLMNYRIHCLD